MDRWIRQDEQQEGRPNLRTDDGVLFVFNAQSGYYEPYTGATENHDSAAKIKGKTPRALSVAVARDLPVVAITIIISILTFIVVAIYTCYARTQATAATDSVNNASDAMKLDERAWVSVLNVLPVENNQTKIVFQNTGKTPAINFYVAVDVSNDASTREEVLTGKSIVAPSGQFHSMVAPSSGYRDSGDLIVHGKASYDSIFGHPHWVKFCFIRSKTSKGFVACETGNSINTNVP